MKKRNYDICIIGAGASGTIAAVAAKRVNPDLRICILEKNREILRKVLASGNGRCNISNANCENRQEIEDFFREMGVIFAEEEEGRLYPYNRTAVTVADAFKRQLKRFGVDVYCGAQVTEITEDLQVHVKGAVFEAKAVLLSAGGKSYPEFGTTGDGYIMARKLGISVKPLRPVLTALVCRENMENMKGVRELAQVTLLQNGQKIASEKGQVQFTKDGLSGICIFNLSRLITLDRSISMEEAFSRYTVSIDFLPEFSQEEYEGLLKQGCAGSLVRKETLQTAGRENLKNWQLTVAGARGWKDAQVTAGGVAYSQVNGRTMESEQIPGLYFAGEMMDYDGPCGGYNLNHAWTTGIKAGRAMAERCTE